MDPAKLLELVCVLPTHLFAGGERGSTASAFESNVTHKVAAIKEIQTNKQKKVDLCKVSYYSTTVLF